MPPKTTVFLSEREGTPREALGSKLPHRFMGHGVCNTHSGFASR